MLDPLSALSLASAIVQITDFGCKLLSQTQEIYHSASGATREIVTVGEITQDISVLYADLKRKNSAFHRSTADDIAIGTLVDSCTEAAGELLVFLRTLKVRPGSTQWKSLRVAIRSALNKSKVQTMEARLLKIQRQIDSRLHKMITNQQSALCLRMNDISKEHTRLQLESVHHIDQLKAEIRQYSAQVARDSDSTRILIQRLDSLAAEGQRVANEERILKSLEFDEWKRRFNDVRKAHSQTFDWMLEDSKDPLIPRTGFRDWLRSQESIFWISGKPGSGKSTLMKFLSEHPEVKHHLREWAGDSAEPIVISWFFWAAGSPMQRSKEGLFQSLLLQILRRCPELLPLVCAERWQDESEYGEKGGPWSLDELDRAFDILAQQPILGERFCMFVDGLDEYGGLPIDIIRRLQLLARSGNIKLCLSSRPDTPFVTAFQDGSSILLQNHTKRDIERFVKDILEKDDTFTQAERKDKRYRRFIYEVIERAQGVFLWVYLVVNELLKGLSERNKLEDLKDKLDTLPDSLEEYFQRIFDGIDKAHQTESAKVFLLTTHAVIPLSVICYNFLEREHRAPGYALKAGIQPLTSKELEHLYNDVRNRLNFLCKNLLEVNRVVMDHKTDYQIDFIHRTVRDFLMTKDMHQVLIQRATEANQMKWNAHVALCRVQLARAKTLGLQTGIKNDLNVLFALVDTTMFYAHEVENEEKRPETDLLDQLDDTVLHFADADMVYHWTNARDRPQGNHFDEDTHNSFLALAVQNRLVLYVREKLAKNPKILSSKKGRPLLDYALRPRIVTPIKLPQLVEFINLDIIRMLLDKGANPNEKVSIYGNITVWGLFLLSCYEMKDIDETQAKDTWFKAAELMIRKGADKTLKLETKRRERVVENGPAEFLVTVKYRRQVQLGGPIEIDVPVELTAMDIMKEIFMTGKIAEIEAIVPEGKSWSFWDLIPWT